MATGENEYVSAKSVNAERAPLYERTWRRCGSQLF